MRPRQAVVAAALLLAAGGCVGVPSGGRVISGNAGGAEQPAADPYVRIIPVGPQRDADPVTIVRAFRTASASFDGPNGDHQVAREYLVCASCWQPGVASIVYDHIDQPVLQPVGDGSSAATVTVQGHQRGRIGADGQYIADPRGFKEQFQLRRDAQRQWRIAQAPQELVLSRDDVDRAFRTLDLYFFAPDTEVLVPNPVFIPLVSRSWIATRLVRQLIGGPTNWLKGAAVRSAFPAGARLRGLDIVNGLATVDLSSPARAGDLRGMSIQLMWTLRQLPEVRRMRLRIDGTAADVPGVGGMPESAGDGNAGNPDGDGTGQPAYVRTADGLLARLDLRGPQPLQPKLQVNHPAVSYDHREVASLNPDGDRLTVTDLVAGLNRVGLRAAAKDGRFTTPSWDTRGNVWTVESTTHGSRLWVIEGGTHPVPFDSWALAQYPVKALRVARDGTRAAVIVQVGGGWQVQLGRVDRAPSGGLQAEGFIAISSELQSITDLAWRTADQLAVIGAAQGNPSPLLYDVPVSGTEIQPMIGPGGDMEAIAAYPGAPLLVTQHVSGAQRLSVCRLSDRYDEWSCFDRTSDPAYPG